MGFWPKFDGKISVNCLSTPKYCAYQQQKNQEKKKSIFNENVVNTHFQQKNDASTISKQQQLLF